MFQYSLLISILILMVHAINFIFYSSHLIIILFNHYSFKLIPPLFIPIQFSIYLIPPISIFFMAILILNLINHQCICSYPKLFLLMFSIFLFTILKSNYSHFYITNLLN